MKTQTYLRPWVQKTLECITIGLIIILGSLHDFDLGAFPYILGMMGIVAMNVYILEKYGRY